MTNLSMLTAAIGILSVLHPAAASDLVRDPYAAVREESSSPATTTLLVTKTATLARSTGGPRVDIMSVDVETGSSEDVDSVIARLLESGGIESVELDRPAKLVQEQQLERTNLPNDPDYEAQWHLPFINAPVAWAIATGSSDVKVCLIDSGVERSHTDLNYNLEHFKGDHAYRNSSRDATGHGTHMAGIIAAKGSNAFEVTGVNWNANLISCRFVQENGSGMVSDAINCMYWCEKQGAKIINNSWTTNYRMDALAKSMEDLGTRGVLFVSAAANQGVNLEEEVDHFPAGFNELDNQLVVGALEPDGTLAPYSNYGTAFVHIAAPGSNILSLVRFCTITYELDAEQTYKCTFTHSRAHSRTLVCGSCRVRTVASREKAERVARHRWSQARSP